MDFKRIDSSGVNQRIIAFFKMVRFFIDYSTKNTGAQYHARENEDWISMNFLAEQLLTLKRYEEAKVISENNVLEFPDKDLVRVNMGNIYLALNQKEDAIKSYKKALELTPGYEEAKNRLKELEGK